MAGKDRLGNEGLWILKTSVCWVCSDRREKGGVGVDGHIGDRELALALARIDFRAVHLATVLASFRYIWE